MSLFDPRTINGTTVVDSLDLQAHITSYPKLDSFLSIINILEILICSNVHILRHSII